MTVAKGTHNIGSDDGKVLVNVWKDGVAAKMGHDLTLEATSWSGKADINPDDPSSSSIEVTIDASSLEVVAAVGGASALSQSDKGKIADSIKKTLDTNRHSEITFTSTAVSASSVKGDLEIVGKSRPVTLDLTVDDGGHAVAKVSFKQTDFGIKPFSAMLGALKIKDGVDITVDVQLPTA
jgi:polyisoprenoid-binding protein YceI